MCDIFEKNTLVGYLHLHFKGLRRDANDTASAQQYTHVHNYFVQTRKTRRVFIQAESKACCHYNRLSSYTTEVFLKEKNVRRK